MTTGRTITIDETRQPLGAYTWVATLRDGTQLIEWETDKPQLSFDIVACRDDVAEVAIIYCHKYILGTAMRIVVQPGERVTKKWIRTFHLNLDTQEQSEYPVVDTAQLITDKPIYHHCMPDGMIVVTTNPEP